LELLGTSVKIRNAAGIRPGSKIPSKNWLRPWLFH
jgi:hypothetical protein